jgi:hypothetical protein
MADEVFTIRVGDLRPFLATQLTRKNENGVAQAVNLTGASGVSVRLKKPDNQVVTAAAVITDTALGKVEYQWASGDTALAGLMTITFLVTWPSAKPESFPPDGAINVRVTPILA